MLRCNAQAVSVAAMLFVLPYALILVSAVMLLPSDVPGLEFKVIALAAFPVVLSLIVSGYVAARVAGASGVANGAAAGLVLSLMLLGGPFAVLDINMALPDYIREYGPHALVMGVFWCSLGGLIWELISNYRLAQ